MDTFVIEHEPVIRLVLFFGILMLMVAWELFAPRRNLTTSKSLRWSANLVLVAVNSILVRVIFPVAAVGIALIADEQHWGLLNNTSLPMWLELLIAVVLLDLVIYLQHVMFHAIPLLWRLHMVHHTDLDFDVTTGVRFHPLEIILSMIIKIAAVTAIGPAAIAVIIFEIVLNASSMFNHGNIKLPGYIDRVLRLMIVTPDMHRVHHSVIRRETNSNYGFNLAWWDRLFGTYRDQPAAGHKDMIIGLEHFRDPGLLTLPRLLALPVTGRPGIYPINRGDEKK